MEIAEKTETAARGTPSLKTYRLERLQTFPGSGSDVFAFFSDAFNLKRITPSFLSFHILTPLPIKMGEGTVIDYRLSLWGMPVYWQTLIEKWTPEASFVDTQIRGPYALWQHTHSFQEQGPGVLMRDVVEYAIPYGVLGRIAHAFFIRRWLNLIFDYRSKMTARLLGTLEPEAEQIGSNNGGVG